jgi:hypothetical protein
VIFKENNRGTFSDLMSLLSDKATDYKIRFLDYLLFEITIMNRAIWSDNEYSDTDKVDLLKWSNELTHRLWNLSFDLKRNDTIDFAVKFKEHIDFYRNQSNEFSKHISATLNSVVDKSERLLNK